MMYLVNGNRVCNSAEEVVELIELADYLDEDEDPSIDYFIARLEDMYCGDWCNLAGNRIETIPDRAAHDFIWGCM